MKKEGSESDLILNEILKNYGNKDKVKEIMNRSPNCYQPTISSVQI